MLFDAPERLGKITLTWEITWLVIKGGNSIKCGSWKECRSFEFKEFSEVETVQNLLCLQSDFIKNVYILDKR